MEQDRREDTNSERAGRQTLNRFITLPRPSLGQTTSWTTLWRTSQEVMIPDPCKHRYTFFSRRPPHLQTLVTASEEWALQSALSLSFTKEKECPVFPKLAWAYEWESPGTGPGNPRLLQEPWLSLMIRQVRDTLGMETVFPEVMEPLHQKHQGILVD